MTEGYPTNQDDDLGNENDRNETSEHALVPVSDRNQAATTAGREVVKLAGTELLRAGSSPDWHVPSKDLVVRPINGVFLGDFPNADGVGSRYIDSSRTPTGQGFKFIVGRNTAGLIYIEAQPEGDNVVEAFSIDEETGLPVWLPTDPILDNGVRVSDDYGKLVTDDDILQKWKDDVNINLGNPGGQVGVIRVTSPDGNVRYFAMGANFDGREKAWRVNGMFAPVNAQNIEALTAMNDGTNQKLAIEAAEAVEAAKPKPREESDYYFDREKGRVSPDPLYEKRQRVRDQAGVLLHELKDTLLPQLLEKGLVVEAHSSYSASKGMKLYVFTQPQRMPDGRDATLEFEVPIDPEEESRKHWGLKLKMAYDEGTTIHSRGYTEAEIKFIPPYGEDSQGRIGVSGTEARNGRRNGVNLEQRHDNTMHMEVIATAKAVEDADRFLRSLAQRELS